MPGRDAEEATSEEMLATLGEVYDEAVEAAKR